MGWSASTTVINVIDTLVPSFIMQGHGLISGLAEPEAAKEVCTETHAATLSGIAATYCVVIALHVSPCI